MDTFSSRMAMKQKIQLNLGCGIILVKNFINVDKFYTLKELQKGAKTKKGFLKGAVIERGSKFIQADMCKLPFKDNYADYIETIDTIEHISYRVVLEAFKEMYRVLKPGGKLHLVTTNFDHLAELWTKKIAGRLFDEETKIEYLNLMEVIYGNQLSAGEFHVVPYNPYFLGFILDKAGFKASNIKMTMHPMGSPGPGAKVLKTTRWPHKNVPSMRTDMILVQAKK